MYEWRNANVNSNTRKAFEIATSISWVFDDDKVRSAYLLFAAMNIPDAAISKIISDMNFYVVPDIPAILTDKELFADIFGKEAAEKVFEKAKVEETQKDNNTEPVENEKTAKPSNDADEITLKVLEVLSSLIDTDDEQDEDVMGLIEPVYSDKLEQACDEAYRICNAMNKDALDLDVIICCILQNEESSAYRFVNNILSLIGINTAEFVQSMKKQVNIVESDDGTQTFVAIPSALDTCVEILNKKYKKGEEITILGRDKEIYKAFSVFSKKTKRNTVLVGMPGVGKTAIIEAITQSIVNETCPAEFIGYTVLSLDVNAMVAGTKYRGEFETKVAILKEFLEGTKNIILFVDEMHQMLGAGSSAEGNVDLSGSLKPILSRDDVVFVGATTINEYNTIMARDGAFKRRFEVIIVNEPKRDEIKPMIKAKLKSMEKYHGVKMPGKQVDYIILCSNCFNMDNANPDKTLDLCDRSMAIAKMAKKTVVTKADIHKVYEEYFEMYEKLDKEYAVATAYHEIGHYIATRLTKKNKAMHVTAISIIPAEDFAGVNMLEYRNTLVSCDMEYVEAYMMSLMAGRVAQYRITRAIDSGASNDLQRAKDFARRVITDFGMDEGEYKNICLVDGDIVSEKMAEEINEKVNALIRKVYAKTEEFVEAHWEEIDKMAKYLLKKKIVTSDELEQFITT